MGQRKTRPESRKTLLHSSCSIFAQLFNTLSIRINTPPHTFLIQVVFENLIRDYCLLLMTQPVRVHQVLSQILIGELLVATLSTLLLSCPALLHSASLEVGKSFQFLRGIPMLCVNSTRSLSKEVLQGQLGPGTLNRTRKNTIFHGIVGQTRVSSLNYVHSSAKS